MVKKGPCLHCGINFTPLWRNGPAEKPVLCNACGSRYKLKGNLENYFPKNTQFQLCLNEYDGSNLNAEEKPKLSNHVLGTSNGNNSTNSGGISPNLWNSKIPSKKRSAVVYKRMTPMEKFHKQLLSLLRCQGQSNESFSGEVLLLDNVNNFIPVNEIGLGGILLKPDQGSLV